MKREPVSTLGEDLRFEVRQAIGAGGMGLVYEAYDRKRHLLVALKTLPTLEPRALYRFKQEFRLLADLAHPNLVALYELFATGEQWFFTMELVRGVGFLDYVRGIARSTSQPVPVDTASSNDETATAPPSTFEAALAGRAGHPPAQVGPPLRDFSRLRSAGRQLVAALSTLHRAGRLHCDIKPSNVLVEDDGRLVVLDFGLALELDIRPSASTSAGEFAGTPSYMAPEQVTGTSLSPAADWYAVGTMLYEALTGRLPFSGTPREALAAKHTSIPDAPERLNPDVPRDLSALCMALLRSAPQDRPDATEILRIVAGPATESRAGGDHPATELVGRERHLAALEAAFAAVRRKLPMWIFVHGSSGVGKSAIAEHFVRQLREHGRALVFSGRCYEQESVQYKAVDSLIDALSRHLTQLSAADLDAIMPDDGVLLARMFPVLQRVDRFVTGVITGAAITNPQELRTRASNALAQLLAALARTQPVVLFVDDLQWGDLDSASLLLDVFGGSDPPGVLLIGCYRHEYREGSACLQALLAGGAGPARRALAVDPLDTFESEQLALRLLGHEFRLGPSTAGTIAREAGGSPFFIHALVEHAHAEARLSDASVLSEGVTLDEVLRRRFNRLRASARRLLEVVALAGRPVSEDDAFAAADLEERDPALIGALRAGQLLRSSGGEHPQLEAYHDRIREAATALLPPATVTRIHRRLAETLAAKPIVDAEWVGSHYEGAGETALAATHYADAAATAAGVLAFDRAASLYQRAIDMKGATGVGVYQLLVGRGDALANAGRGRLAAETYQQAARLAPATDVLELERRAGYHYCIGGHLDEGLAVLSACLKRVGLRLPATAPRAIVPLLVRSVRLWIAERRGRFDGMAAPKVASSATLMRLDLLWAAAAGLSQTDNVAAAGLLRHHLLLALAAGEPGRLAKALALHAVTIANLGPRGQRRALSMAGGARRLADRGNLPDAQAMALIARAWAELQAFRWSDGFATLTEAEEILRSRCTGVSWELSLVHLSRVTFMRVEGRYLDAAREGRAIIEEARQRGDIYTEARIAIFVVPDEHILNGDYVAARRALRQLSRDWSRAHFRVQKILRCLAEINIDLHAGRARAAWRRCCRYWPMFKKSQQLRVEVIRNLAYLLRAGAGLAAIDEAPALADQLFASATRDARFLARQPGEQAQTMSAIINGVIAIRRGEATLALAHFDRAAEWFEQRGQRSFAAATRHCQGRIVGGPEGGALIAKAEDWFARQGFRTPSAAIPSHVPGFPSVLNIHQRSAS